MTRRRLLVAVAVLVVVACGRKAPPIPPELARPEPPEDLAAIATPDGVKLTWLRPVKYSGGQRMNDLAAFEILRAPGEGEPLPFAQIDTLEVQDQMRFRKERHVEWTDKDAIIGTRYLYEVRAVTLDGSRSTPAGPVAVRFGPETPPPATKEPHQ